MTTKSIKTETVRPSKFVEQDKGDPCYLCGRATKGKHWIFALNGGNDIACETPSEEDHANLVIWPVGPTCSKRIRKAGGLVVNPETVEKFQDFL